ncbi:FAD/NAD(P)-binding protein [Candidatus Bipolaricaulota bacterium]|nr:FAD/NAD(P)-binding protein [Candidatus Bipolaricaulota bacterium]
MNQTNPYLPLPVTIDKITIENEAKDLKTFRLRFQSDEDVASFQYECGQFAMLSIAGAGESPIGIASSPLDEGYIEFTVKRYPTGVVTTALHNFDEGETIGLRGPFGNAYPLEQMEGSNLVVVSGGFAFTTLRSTIRYLLHESQRGRFKDITAIYGARSPGELLYKDELAEWEGRDDIEMTITVDKGDKSWSGREGFVPTVLQEIAPSADNAYVLVCGPPIMLKFTMPPLLELGFPPDRIITSLERKMTCGIGKCGRCNVGSKYVCKDGPVFTYEQLQQIPEAVL